MEVHNEKRVNAACLSALTVLRGTAGATWLTERTLYQLPYMPSLKVSVNYSFCQGPPGSCSPTCFWFPNYASVYSLDCLQAKFIVEFSGVARIDLYSFEFYTPLLLVTGTASYRYFEW